jgi:hypothetical protein
MTYILKYQHAFVLYILRIIDLLYLMKSIVNGGSSMNLTKLYNNGMYPASKIEVGMELIISNCKSYFIKDGTIVKVTVAGEKCEHITEGCIKSGCCRRNIVAKESIFVNLSSCISTFHTLNGRLVVSDEEYYKQRKGI